MRYIQNIPRNIKRSPPDNGPAWLIHTQGVHLLQITRGGSRFCGGWSLYNFGGNLLRKKYKITNTKLGLKSNIYLGPLGKWGTLKLMLHKLHGKSILVDNTLCNVLSFCRITYESAWWMNHKFKLEHMYLTFSRLTSTIVDVPHR